MTAPVIRALAMPLAALLVETDDVDWHLALCAEEDYEAWFPFPSESYDYAAGVCARCPISGGCRDFAATNGESGVWGGVLFDNGRPSK